MAKIQHDAESGAEKERDSESQGDNFSRYLCSCQKYSPSPLRLATKDKAPEGTCNPCQAIHSFSFVLLLKDMKFTEFTLDSGLQEGLAEAGYITCMPVQEQVLQNGLEGGRPLRPVPDGDRKKTAAYLVTILQRLASDPSLSGKKALVMVSHPRTRRFRLRKKPRILGSCMKLKSASLFTAGVGYGRQVELLKEGVDIIIGTPGRVHRSPGIPSDGPVAGRLPRHRRGRPHVRHGLLPPTSAL